MRLLILLAALGLLASAYLAPNHYRARPGEYDPARFVDPPAVRAEKGVEENRPGVALAGYEDLVLENPDDLDALRGRIRASLMLDAVAFGQPDLGELLQFQIEGKRGPDQPVDPNNYLDRRAELDPDGSFLQEALTDWVEQRLVFNFGFRMGFYARTAACLYLAARGDQRGIDGLFELAKHGRFYLEIFPYVRRFHPTFAGIRPLIVHYLGEGGLAGRVEAGVTLLDYYLLFGEGEELVERHLPEIRRAIREVRSRLSRGVADEATAAGRSAICGMGLLAALGEKSEHDLLAKASSPAELAHYAPYADTVRMARLMAGVAPFEEFAPTTQKYAMLEPLDQRFYYVAAAYRAATLKREDRTEDPEYRQMLRHLQGGFDSARFVALRFFCLQTLMQFDPDAADACILRGVSERSGITLFAAVLSERLTDLVPILLPIMRSPEPDMATLAVVSLLDLGDTPALQK